MSHRKSNSTTVRREWVTPHKISLAVLVTVYAAKDMSDSCHHNAKSPVLVVGHESGEGPAAAAATSAWPSIGARDPGSAGASPGGAGEVSGRQVLSTGVGWNVIVKRNFARSMLKWIQSFDMEFQDLLVKVKTISEELSRDLLETLGTINMSGLSALADFIHSLDKLLDSNNGQSPVHRHSILGIFIRRMVLSYDKLSFDRVSKLYKSIKAYLSGLDAHLTESERSRAMMDVSVVDDGGTMTKDELEGTAANSRRNGCISNTEGSQHLPTERSFAHQQAEFFIAQQACFLQNADPRALSPRSLQEQIEALKETNPDLAEAHFLYYLNCLRVSEFCGATHSLHSYFDHLAPRAGDTGSNRDETKTQSFRYAALSLAGLYCNFGHREEALLALQEAIRIAHESNDNVCLQHALGWLYRIEKMNGEDISYLLDCSISRSDALNLPYLTSLGIQNFAQHKALGTTDPASVFEYLIKSDVINCKMNQPQLVQTSLSQQSALWRMYGHSTMSSLCDQLLLQLGQRDPPIGSTNNSLITTESEVLCLAMCNQARLHADQGMYGAAADIIQLAQERFPLPLKHAKLWMECEQQLAFDKALLEGKWQHADQAVQNLASLNEKDTLYRRGILLRERGEMPAAFDVINRIISRCTENKEGYTTELHVRALLQLGALHSTTSNYTSAIPHLLEALALCQTHHLSTLLAMATASLAQIQLMLKMPEHALALVERIMPQVLANGSLYDQCRVKFLYTKCQLACTSGKKSTDNRKSVLLSVVQHLHDVIEGFRRLGAEYRVKDIVYLQAHLYNELGYMSERNRCSLQFRQLEHQYPTAVIQPTSTL